MCCLLSLKFLVPADNCICIMHKGGRPCDKSAVTMNREREEEEQANPEKKQRRIEDDNCKKINFFAGHTRATVSAGADIVTRSSVGVHESLMDIVDRLEDRFWFGFEKYDVFVCELLALSLPDSL